MTERSSRNGRGEPQARELLDDYRLGEMIGQGAFGVVYLCTKKGGGKEEYAVKMIDKVETPLEEIQQECQMLQKLTHPTVVKLHQVYYEKVFVCMVMDIYKGGDLIEGMQDHWQNKGMIPCAKIPHIARQMMEPIAWLHSKNCAHRDIKGDNYLMNIRDILHPDLKLYLSDFGTVCEIKEGGRMKNSVGTKIYWAPEQFQKDYGLKVDVWAAGVVVFGLVEGKFPFKGQTDVCRKAVKLPRRAPEAGKDFINKLLAKAEAERPAAQEALALPWVGGEKGSAPPPPQPEAPAEKEEEFKPDSFDRGGNAGIAERRRILVERLENSKKAKELEVKGTILWLPLATFWKPSFEVPQVKKKIRFEWQTPDQIQKAGNAILNMMQSRKATPEDNGSVAGSIDVIGAMLTEHGIDVKAFGKNDARSLDEFVDELHRGPSRIMLDAAQHKSIVRVVDIVLLRIVHGAGRLAKFLIKSSEAFSDGRTRTDIDQLPGTKKDPHENTLQVAERLLSERLNMSDCKVCLDFSNTEIFEEEDYSPSYPGVRTVYRKEIVQGQVISTDKAILERIGLGESGSLTSEDSKKCVRVYHWLSEADCDAKKVKLRAPKEGSEVSALVQAPVGFEEEALIELLLQNGIDVSKFGDGHTKTLKEFSEELIRGEATIAKVKGDKSSAGAKIGGGQLRRIVDVVVLKLAMPKTGSILVEAEEIYEDQKKILNWLPAAKRRPDENQFLAAQRVIQLRLKMDPNYVVIDQDDVRIVEEEKDSFHFPGLRTLYKKRIITAKLMRTAEFVSSRHTLGSRGPGLAPS